MGHRGLRVSLVFFFFRTLWINGGSGSLGMLYVDRGLVLWGHCVLKVGPALLGRRGSDSGSGSLGTLWASYGLCSLVTL